MSSIKDIISQQNLNLLATKLVLKAKILHTLLPTPTP